MSKLLLVALAIIAQVGSVAAMPALRATVSAAPMTVSGIVRAQYYYKGHTYKRKTRQHFVRKYSGNDR